MNRYSVDPVLWNDGSIKGYAIFDEYQQDYVGGDNGILYSDIFMAQEDCDIMNEGEELENGREFG